MLLVEKLNSTQKYSVSFSNFLLTFSKYIKVNFINLLTIAVIHSSISRYSNLIDELIGFANKIYIHQR